MMEPKTRYIVVATLVMIALLATFRIAMGTSYIKVRTGNLCTQSPVTLIEYKRYQSGVSQYYEADSSGTKCFDKVDQIQDGYVSQQSVIFHYVGKTYSAAYSIVYMRAALTRDSVYVPLMDLMIPDSVYKLTYIKMYDTTTVDSVPVAPRQALDTGAYIKAGVNNQIELIVWYYGDTLNPTTWSVFDYNAGDTTCVVIPPSPQTCRCRVYVYTSGSHGQGSTPVVDAKVTFSLSGQVNNSCDSMIIAPTSVYDYTDANGIAEVDLLWSACLDNRPYNMSIQSEALTVKDKKVIVPSQNTYTIFWNK